MFINTALPPDKVLQILIENYFDNVRTYCEQDISEEHLSSIQQTGAMMLNSMVSAIIELAPPEEQVKLFEQIQHRFMFVLRDYNKEWVWDLLGLFSQNLPEQMLH